ncbi:MAG: hypothetical protein H6563_08840 [Lewinellaceae bacterium]|nr:hypothetical protein [Lewinellaceae bacterium]
MYAEAEKLGIGFLDELVAALQVESLQYLLDMGQEQLGSMLSDVLGFNPLDLMGEAMDVIDEGLDATLNLFFWSNTSATANGALVISVGRQRDALQVHSQILYTREAQEATSEAMQGSGEKCGELLLSDVLPGELHITTEGLASLTARASGNGNASAYLESQHLQVFVGVCICRDQDKPTVVSFVNHGWYTQARDPAMDQVQGEVEQDLDEFLKEKIDGGELTKESSQRDWKAAVEGFVRGWGEENAFCK